MAKPSAPPPQHHRRGGRRAGAAAAADPSIRNTTGRRTPTVLGTSRQAPGRSRQGDRPRQVHVRHQASGHALRAHRPLAASARARACRSICRRRSGRPASRSRSCIAIPPTTKTNVVMFQGDEVAAVAADTEEHAIDAARLIKVEYEVLPHVISVDQALAGTAPPVFTGGNVRAGTDAGNRRPRGGLQGGGASRSKRPTRRTSSRTSAWSRTAPCASGTATS